MTLKAAFIGLGAMGEPMAGHLKQQGLLHAVANRTHAKAEALARTWDVSAPTLEELAAQCDVIALCVTADADVLTTVDALAPHVKPGTIVIDHSTVAPDTAKQAAARLAAVKAHFLDAPVSGGVEGAKNGKLSIMVGGDAAVLERARPVLEAYALRITHLGDVGAGQATKAINQVLVAGIAQAVCEGLALGEALGLDPERLIPTLGAGAAAQGSGHRAWHCREGGYLARGDRAILGRLCRADAAGAWRRRYFRLDPAEAAARLSPLDGALSRRRSGERHANPDISGSPHAVLGFGFASPQPTGRPLIRHK